MDSLRNTGWESGIQAKSWRLIEDIYRYVKKIKVCLAIFYQDYGVKHGYILPRTLFCILMNDLVKMLNDKNIGVELSPKLINCLLFAIDVVLIFRLCSKPRKKV